MAWTVRASRTVAGLMKYLGENATARSRPQTRRAVFCCASAIAFRAVVRLAKQLAIFDGRVTAFAPCRHVVGIHFWQGPDFLVIGLMADCAMRAVRFVLGLRLLGLCRIDRLLGCFVKNSQLQ